MSHSEKHTLIVSASTENLSEVRHFVSSEAKKYGFSSQDIDGIKLAVDEAFTNIIKHAYNFDKNKKVSFKTGFGNNDFWISICDDGIPFDPIHYAEPNIPERVKKGKRGGVGIYLIKKLMDKVEYSTLGKQNEIRLIKHR